MIKSDSKTHAIGAACLGYAIASASKKVNLDIKPAIFIVSSIVGGLLPDIDHPKSYLGRKIQPVSSIIFAMFGHRTITHSLLFVAIISFVLSLRDVSAGTGLMVGLLSHITLDMLTPHTNGVALYYPISKKKIKLSKYKPNATSRQRKQTDRTNARL